MSCEWLLNFPPAPISAQSVTHIAGSGTTVYQCCTPASCRRPRTRTGQRRGRLPTPGDPALWTRAKTKTQIPAKGTTERAIHRTKEKTTSVIFLKCPAREFIPITVLIHSKKRIKLQSLLFKLIRKTIKSAPRISVIIFRDGIILVKQLRSSKAPDSFARNLITTFQRSRAAGRFSLHSYFMRTGT